MSCSKNLKFIGLLKSIRKWEPKLSGIIDVSWSQQHPHEAPACLGSKSAKTHPPQCPFYAAVSILGLVLQFLVPLDTGECNYHKPLPVILMFWKLLPSFILSLIKQFWFLLHARHNIKCFRIWSDLASPLTSSCSPAIVWGPNWLPLEN